MSEPSVPANMPEEAKRIAARVVPVVAAEPDVVALYLFGSRATGEHHEGSDVDLGVLFASKTPLERVFELEGRLERALGQRTDLVDVGRASAYLALDIIRGERLFARDEDRTDEFDLYVMRRAGDLWPFEQERRRMALRP